jgi:opacity protein-like surface antigen
MKKIALVATLALALAGTAKADWVDTWGFGGGYTQSPDLDYGGTAREMDFGYNVGAFVGWKQSEDVSFMADFMFAESEYKGFASSIQSLSVMLDAMYVCDTGDFWRPFIGAGAGAVEVNFDRSATGPFLPGSLGSGSEWAFGYQGMAGIAFAVDDTHAITIGYRYQAAEDVTIAGRNIEYATHNISIGVAFD